jgi:hypothetical protein
MRQATITSFVDYVRETDFFDLVAHFVVFRGQAVEGNLLPGIARKDPETNPLDRELEMLKQLRLLGAALLPAGEMETLDLLVLAQHYGLETRLLDWTTNPLAALWFACADRRLSGDVFVYALEADDHLDPEPYDSDPLKLLHTKVFQPRFNNPRIIAQQGWFSLHRFSAKDKRFVPLEASAAMKGNLTEFRIPEKSRGEILQSLDRHGISARTLFPDMHGLCQYLNWRHR